MDPRKPSQERRQQSPVPPASRQDELIREEYIEAKLLGLILDELREQTPILNEIAGLLRLLVQQGSVSAQSMTLIFIDSKGQVIPMPATIQVGQTATAVAQEWSGPNGTGSPLAAAGPIGFTSSDPAIATVDPVSGKVTAVAPGTATITALDSVNGLTASDTVSDQPLEAQSMTVVVTADAVPAPAPGPTPVAPALKTAAAKPAVSNPNQ